MGTFHGPEWKVSLEKSINQYPGETVMQIATLDPISPFPRVRSHIFRSFLYTPTAPDLPLLISTTDVRTPKVTQIIAHPDIELVWWIASTQQQYRISGKAHIIPSPRHSLYSAFADTLQSEKLGHGSGLAVINSEKFDWEAKRLEIWSKLSSHMKASWARPTPGSPMKSPDDAKNWPPTVEEPREGDSGETRRNWEYALGNFALVVIDPYEVDFVNMGVVPNLRTKHTRKSEGKWDAVAVVP